MDTRSRKFLSRLGAAMLLGLSLFNLAAAFGKTKGEEISKRARQIRKREKEEVKPEVQMVADIAEQEAKAVIAQQEAQTQTQTQVQQLSLSQQAIRAVALVIWTATAVVFFGSMVFNYPFALGKGALSLLPGVPHVASLQLRALEQTVPFGSPVRLDMILDSNGEAVHTARSVIQYDPALSQYERVTLKDKEGVTVRSNLSQTGRVELVFTFLQSRVFQKESIATIQFIPAKASKTTYHLDFDQSIVLKRSEGKDQNILGKVSDAQVRLPNPQPTTVHCTPLHVPNDSVTDESMWKDFFQTRLVGDTTQWWTSVTEDIGFRCGSVNTEPYLVIAMPKERIAHLAVRQHNQTQTYRSDTVLTQWHTDTQTVWVLRLPASVSDQSESIPLSLQITPSSGDEIRWPAFGTAQIVFE